MASPILHRLATLILSLMPHHQAHSQITNTVVAPASSVGTYRIYRYVYKDLFYVLYVYIYILYVYILVYMCMYYLHTLCVCVCVYIYVYILVYMCMCVYIYICIYSYICVCIICILCVWVYIYIYNVVSYTFSGLIRMLLLANCLWGI